MKARDIITDWPRGTSTLKPFADNPASSWLPWVVNELHQADFERFQEDALGDEAYHAAQARMMDDWHRSRGGSTSELAHGLFVGSLVRAEALSYELTWGERRSISGVPMFKLVGFEESSR